MMKKQTPGRMQRLVVRWRTSGESGAGFARRHGIPAWTFWYWPKAAAGAADSGASDCASVRSRAGGVAVRRAGRRDRLPGGHAPAGASRRTRGVGAQRYRGVARGMLTLSPAVRIYLATGATDLRRSIDGLAALVHERFTLDPFSGHLFLLILAWDRSGFWVLYKRLEQGTFAWPAEDASAPVEMHSTDLALFLSGVDVAQTRRRRWYERMA